MPKEGQTSKVHVSIVNVPVNVSETCTQLPREGSCNTAQSVKFSIKDFFSKCEKICRQLRIWSCFLKRPIMENFIFFSV